MENFDFTRLEKQSQLSYVQFDPEGELNKLKSMPKNERRVAIVEFKEMIIKQKAGLAETISRLYADIQANSDLSAAELMGDVMLNAAEYRFTDVQINNFKKALDDYEKKHQIIKKYINKSPEEIFVSCFGQAPIGALDVKYGPLTISIVCENELDFARARNWHLDMPTNMGMEDIVKITNSWHSDGSAFNQVLNDELNGIVTIARKKDDPGHQEVIEVHEEQHQFNNLFQPEKRNHIFEDIIEEKRGQAGVETQVLRIIRFDKEYLGIDNRIRDEALAYYKDGRSADDIYQTLIGSRLYDYPQQYKDALLKFPKRIAENVTKYDMRLGEQPAAITEERVKELMDDYFSSGYKEDIRRWTNSIKVLESKSYTREEIVELLFPFAISEWPAIARRA